MRGSTSNKIAIRMCLGIINEEYDIDKAYIGKEIVFFTDRKKHIEKQKSDFTSDESFNCAFKNMHSIVSEPDFVTYDETNNSLLFIKTMMDSTLIAARVSISSELKVKIMYPINKTKKEKLLKKSKVKC